MKTPVKIFACAALASLAFLACNDIGTNANNATEASPTHLGCRTYIPYERLDPICKSESRELVRVFLHLDYEDIRASIGYYSEGFYSEDGYEGGGYFINGKAVIKQEYDAFVKEWNKMFYEQVNIRRDLPIPCVVSDLREQGWIALLTEEEIAELQEKYGELSFGEVVVPVPAGPISDGDVSRDGCN
jgi:hypothetical protein